MYHIALNKEKKRLIESLKLFSVRFVMAVSNSMLLFFQKLLFRKSDNPKKILIFRTGSLGDNLCAIPSMVAIKKKYPGAVIDILSNTGQSNLVSLKNLLDKNLYNSIIDYLGMEKKYLVKMLKGNKYDLVIQLPQTDAGFFRLLRDLFFFRYIAASGWGWQFSTVRFFRRTQEKFMLFPNETKRLADILESQGIAVDQQRYELNFTEEDHIVVRERMAERKLEAGKKNIALVVGAKRAQNRWSLANFKSVIEGIGNSYNFLIVGGPDDKDLAAPILSLPGVYDFCGSLTPMQSALLISRCVLTLSNDTGPMHLSYAVGTPVIALFSSRDFPGKWFPPESEKNKVFRTPGVSCSLCLSENCMNNICMQAIKTQAVIEAMKERL